MKKLIIFALLLSASCAFAQEVTDSTAVKNELTRVNDRLVILSDSTSRDDLSMHFLLGFNAAVNVDAGASFGTFRSWDLAWHILTWDHYFDKQHHHQLSVGAGLEWQYFGVKNNCMYDADAAGNVTPQPFPANVDEKYSGIHVFGFTGFVGYQYNFNKHWSVGIAPVANINTYLSTSMLYQEGDYRHDNTRKNIKPRSFTYGAMLTATLDDVPVYVKYVPCDILKDGSVKFQSLSFGIFF